MASQIKEYDFSTPLPQPQTLDEIITERVYTIVSDVVKKIEDTRTTYPEDWVPVMSPKDVRKVLKISHDTVTNLFNRYDFPSVQISDCRKIVTAQALWDWLSAKNWRVVS